MDSCLSLSHNTWVVKEFQCGREMLSVAGAYPFGLSTWDGWNLNRWFVTYINVIQTKTANADLILPYRYVYFNISWPAFFSFLLRITATNDGLLG